MSIGIMQLSKDFFATGQLSRGDLEAVKEYGFKSVINNRPDGEAIGQPTAEELGTAAEALGLAYAYVPVVSGALTMQNVDDFDEAIRGLESPILLFCRSGTRSSRLWQLSEARKQSEDE